MPFTFVHPVAAVPFKKYGFPISALIIGSMAPDFNYYILSGYDIGHTVLGQFYFCLPLGFFFFIIFHLVIKNPVLDLLPESQSRVLSQIRPINLRSKKLYLYAVFGLLIGSFTHLIWDMFTHTDGIFVSQIPFLKTTILSTSYGSLKLYRIFQHASTFVGAVILIYLYYKWYRTKVSNCIYRSRLKTKHKYLVAGFIFAISFLIAVYNGLHASDIFHFNSFRLFIGTTIRTFIQIFTIMIFYYAIVWSAYFRFSDAE